MCSILQGNITRLRVEKDPNSLEQSIALCFVHGACVDATKGLSFVLTDRLGEPGFKVALKAANGTPSSQLTVLVPTSQEPHSFD